MREAVLLVGTKKGLWIGRSDEDRRRGSWSEPEFLMEGIYATCIDTRGCAAPALRERHQRALGPGRLLLRRPRAGPGPRPKGAAVRFPADLGDSVERVWQIQPGRDEGVIFAGTQPSALFRSEDRGESFELVRSLWDHPHRTGVGRGVRWPGHPHDRARIPTTPPDDGGDVDGRRLPTSDGGGSWAPENKGIKAYFFPDPWPEFGQCVHKVASHPDRPDRMYAQNHHGVYRSDDAGEQWVSIAEGLPADFGFPIVVDPHDPDTVYVFPLVADGARIPPDGQARVWRSQDAGSSWTPSRRGCRTGSTPR